MEVMETQREVLQALVGLAGSVVELPQPVGLGADVVLAEQVEQVAGSASVLLREIAIRMALWEEQAPRPADVAGAVARAGLRQCLATSLRQWGRFAATHPDVAGAWRQGLITAEQVAALAGMAPRLATPDLRRQLVEAVLPRLPGLTARDSRRLIAHAIDILQPGDPEQRETADHHHRYLAWSQAPNGGLVFEGYLPRGDGEAFAAAIDALAEELRVSGDSFSVGQRRADALTELFARATAHGLPTGGGLPVGVTITVGLDEAERIAASDPAQYGSRYQPRPESQASVGGHPAGDAMVRFGLCCAELTPVLAPRPATGGLLDRIAATPVEPLRVGRSVRLATRAQRKALQLLDDGCLIPDCAVTAGYTQPHHVTPWSMDGPTDIDNLVSVCYVHHRQIELGIWVLVARQPGDTRPPRALEHPRYWILRR